MYLQEKLSVTDFIDKTVSDVEHVKPPPVESTSFKLVQDVKDLKELAAKHFCDVATNKEYAREDTHYLLYIYNLMKRKLLSSSTDPNCSEASLVEVINYSLYDADLNGQQLAIVAGFCEWRGVIAGSEDESTGYILPNKVLIEIGNAQMPVTTGKLRHLLKSRRPYIERNLGSIVGIIMIFTFYNFVFIILFLLFACH
ncbi:putative HRDC domain, ribonuclease H superfamily [Helianthus annuus]|nr:putative HRDC domain, ribonuclease H superfamily [Helianthus annuus]